MRDEMPFSLQSRAAILTIGFMDFEQRLQQAIQRGRQASSAEDQARTQRILGAEELRKLHSEYRLQLSEHIDTCLQQLKGHLRGFNMSTIMGDEGWGAELQRDDLGPGGGGGGSSKTYYSRYFSRLLLVVKPFSSAHVVEVTCKGTVRNKEVLNRSQFIQLPDVDVTALQQALDQWVLEFAEKYTAQV